MISISAPMLEFKVPDREIHRFNLSRNVESSALHGYARRKQSFCSISAGKPAFKNQCSIFSEHDLRFVPLLRAVHENSVNSSCRLLRQVAD